MVGSPDSVSFHGSKLVEFGSSYGVLEPFILINSIPYSSTGLPEINQIFDSGFVHLPPSPASQETVVIGSCLKPKKSVICRYQVGQSFVGCFPAIR